MEPNCTNLYIKPGELLKEIDFLIIEDTLKGYASTLVKTIVNNDISLENKRKSLIKYLKRESNIKVYEDMIDFYKNKEKNFKEFKKNEYGLEYISYDEKKHYYNNHFTNHSFICDYKDIKNIPYENDFDAFEVIPYSHNISNIIERLLTDEEYEKIGVGLQKILRKKTDIKNLKFDNFEETFTFLRYYSLLEQLDYLEKLIKFKSDSSEYQRLYSKSLKEKTDLEKQGIKDAYLPKQLIKHFEDVADKTQSYLFENIKDKERAIEIQKSLYPSHILDLIRVNININQNDWDILKTEDFNQVMNKIYDTSEHNYVLKKGY